jgi:hypothetical protein
MIEILRDPIWQSVGIALTILFFLTKYQIQKKRSKKVLAYDIKETTSLVNIHQSIRAKLKILIGEHQVNTVYVTTVVFLNKGNMPITRQDFDENLSIKFTNEGRLLSYDIVDKSPPVLNLKIKVSEKCMEFEPFLLNKEDKFTVKTVIIDGKVNVTPSARIVGGEFKSCADIENASLKKITKNFQIEHVLLLAAYILLFGLFLLVVTS